jgi:hypothetical protein
VLERAVAVGCSIGTYERQQNSFSEAEQALLGEASVA